MTKNDIVNQTKTKTETVSSIQAHFFETLNLVGPVLNLNLTSI